MAAAAAILAAIWVLAPVARCEEEPSESSERPGGRPGRRQLTPEQIEKIKERLNQSLARRGGAGGKLSGKSSASEVANVFKAGEAAYKDEKFPAAYEYFADVAACKDIQGAANYAAKARDYLLKMEQAAAEKLDEAKLARLQDKGPEALDTVKVLLESYPYCRAAEEANGLLITLSMDPRVAAEVAFLQAKALDDAAKYLEAAEAYVKVTKRYPDSVPALKAQVRLKAMKSDEAIAEVIKEAERAVVEKECPKTMIMARNYAMNGLYPQARELYQKVIGQYPDTDYAKEAAEALEELKKQELRAGEKSG
jgi:tetratricopeptide (TPR) repeat protein